MCKKSYYGDFRKNEMYEANICFNGAMIIYTKDKIPIYSPLFKEYFYTEEETINIERSKKLNQILNDGQN